MAGVVVVGAGMGGLAVAARMAAQGHDVHVVEQAPTYGGKVARVEHDGFVFDTGPSLLTLPAVYRDLFLKTAVRRRDARLEDNVDLIPLDDAFKYRWADGTSARLPGAGAARISAALGDALGGSAGEQWSTLLARAGQMWQVTRGPFLESALQPRDLLRLARRVRDVRTVAPWHSLRSIGNRTLPDARLRMLLDRYATYAGSDPRRAPAALAVIPYVEHVFGAWHIGGGIAALARAVYERCLEHGVRFTFGRTVRRVLVDDGRACGVLLDDETRLVADVVVSDADARVLYEQMLDDVRTRGPRRALHRATPSFSAFTMLLAVSGRTPCVAHHNVWFPADYDAEFDAVFDARPTDDPAVYACVPQDARMHPPGTEAWCVLVNAARQEPSRGLDWTAPGLVDAYADRILDVLAARGVDVRARITWRRVITPAHLEQATASAGGAIYGSSSNGPRAAFLRPRNRSPVPGLFLVGGSAHPGGGLPLVGLGAAIVAEQVGTA